MPKLYFFIFRKVRAQADKIPSRYAKAYQRTEKAPIVKATGEIFGKSIYICKSHKKHEKQIKFILIKKYNPHKKRRKKENMSNILKINIK